MLSVVVLFTATLVSGARQVSVVSAPDPNQVRLIVANATSRAWVEDAEVFVLSDTWKELARSKTDKNGIATLPLIAEAERPKYIILTRPFYFIGGTMWDSRAREHFILMTALTVR